MPLGGRRLRVGGHVVGGQEISRLCARMRPPGRTGGNAGATRQAHRACPRLDGRGADRGRSGRKGDSAFVSYTALTLIPKLALSGPANSLLNPRWYAVRSSARWRIG